MKVSIKSVENGVILTTNGKVFVFSDHYELGSFLINRAKDEKELSDPDKTVDLIIHGYGEGKQITCIKLIREVSGLGLKEAKDLSDAIRISGGATVLTSVPRSKALNAQRIFEQDETAGVRSSIKLHTR